MKKNLKAILTVFCAAVLALNFMPTQVKAAEIAENTAYIGFMSGDWAVNYWGEGHKDSTPGVVGTEATVTGAGTYTIGLDFTGTEAGKVEGTQFLALFIEKGEANYPGFIMAIDSFQINGEEIDLGKTYTSSDADGKQAMRSNLYNQWDSDYTKADNFPRTLDGSLEGTSATVLDPALLVGVETIDVTFTLVDPNAAEEAPAAEAPAAEAPAADVPKTGVIGLGLVYGLGALVTGAVVLKRKEK